MKAIPLAEARYQASRVHSPTIICEGSICENDGPPEKWLTIRPFATIEDSPKIASDQLSEIVDKLKPLGWVALDDAGLWGRKVA